MSWVRCHYIYSHFHKKGTAAYITKKNHVLLKKGVFYWASKSAISVEKGVFFFSKIREKGLFFKLGNECGIRFGRELGSRPSKLPPPPHTHTQSCRALCIYQCDYIEVTGSKIGLTVNLRASSVPIPITDEYWPWQPLQALQQGQYSRVMSNQIRLLSLPLNPQWITTLMG